MNQEQFCRKYLGVSRVSFNRALNGHSNLSGKAANIAARKLDTPVEVWLDKNQKEARVEAWESYLNDFRSC